VFSQRCIEKLIEEEQIAISFSSFPEDGSVNEEWLDVSSKNTNIYKAFSNKYFGDRLSLSLGPIVKSHNKEYFRKRKGYKNWSGCFDLRDNNNKLLIYPREVVSVSTVERIKLGNKIAAFTIPRLSNADAGLLYVPSYIDPHWDGILQAVIINVTDSIQELHLGEKIAICRFYNVEGTVGEKDKERFPEKSHHLGNNWNKIIVESANPFPTKKQPLKSDGYFKNITSFLITKWQYLVSLGVGGVSLVGAIFYLGAMHEKLEKLELSQKELNSIQLELKDYKSKYEDVSKSVAESGIVSVDLKKGSDFSSTSFSVKRSVGSISTVWLDTSKNNNVALSAKLTKDPMKIDVTKVTIEVKSESAFTKNGSIDVSWMLVN
jgi:deoxycytidine triphosphate deaminase